MKYDDEYDFSMIDFSKVCWTELETEWIDKYEKSLSDHLKYYREAAIDLGVDPELIKIHDESKGTIEEAPWYVRRFGGGIKEEEFEVAWLHHIHNNPHHWEHWIVPGGNDNEKGVILRMPDEYVLEMVADWMGSSKAYTGSYKMKKWLEDNLHRVRLHEKSARYLQKILISLGYNAAWYSLMEYSCVAD